MQRRVAERIIEAWERRIPRLEPLCRMLLVADRYGASLLRDHCLHCLAARFEALVEERAPQREREVFEAFVAAVAPQVPGRPSHDAALLRHRLTPLQGHSVLRLHTSPLMCCPFLWSNTDLKPRLAPDR